MSGSSRLLLLVERVSAEIKALHTKIDTYSKKGHVYNVVKYGAVGDGTTDDRAAFQTAIDECSAAGGGIVFIPAKTYTVNGVPIRLRNNVHIQGYGATLTKSAGGTVFAALADAVVTGYGSTAKNVKVSGIRFYGGFAAGKGICAFSLHHMSDLVVEDCIFDEIQMQAHTFDMQGCENITIRDNTFLGFENSVTAYAECIQVDASVRGGSTVVDTIGSYDGLFCRNILIDNNQFLPKTVGGTDWPCANPMGAHVRSQGKFHENIRFINNFVQDPGAQVSPTDGDNLGFFYGVIHMCTTRGLIIRDNRFVQSKARACRVISIHNISEGGASTNDPNTTGGTVSTYTPDVCADVSITGNVFDGFGESTNQQEIIWLNGISGSVGYIRRLYITGNTFSNGWVGLGSDVIKAACIGGRYLDGYVIENNKFNNVHMGVYIQSSYRGQIVNNELRNIGSIGVYLLTAGGIIMANNALYQCGRGLLAQHLLDSTINANVIQDPQAGTAIGQRGIYVFGTSTGIMIMANSLFSGTSIASNGIDISATATTWVTLFGNLVRGWTTIRNVGTVTGRNISEGWNYGA